MEINFMAWKESGQKSKDNLLVMTNLKNNNFKINN